MRKTIAAIAFAIGSSAATAGGYIGFGYGQGMIGFHSQDPSPATLTEDDTASAYKVFGGYEFNENFAIEFGYQKFDAFSRKITFGASELQGNFEGSAFFFDELGKIPASSDLSFFGKIGVAQTKLDAKCAKQTGIFAGQCTGGRSESEMNLRFGIGAEFKFTKQLGARLEFERTADVGKSDTTSENDVDYLGLGVTYRF